MQEEHGVPVMLSIFRPVSISLVFVGLVVGLCGVSVYAQESPAPFSAVSIGVKASLLGAGAEIATPLARHFNLRGGINALSYDRNFHKDGLTYAGQLQFRSGEVHLDWFPFGGSFHLSPGALFYNGNQFHASAFVPGSQSFTLNGTTYISDANDPVTGAGKVDFKKAGPMLTAGWGNVLPHGHRHFTIPFEFGAIYTGSPRASLNLAGGACDSTGSVCQSISSSPEIMSNVQAEQAKLNRDMRAFRFYPVVSIGVAFKF
jgi:hypothetical protein